jgi:hypothetical protein
MEQGIVTVETAEDIPAHAAVTLNGSNKLEKSDGNGDDVFGIVQEYTPSGRGAPVKTEGSSKALVDGSSTSLAVGDMLMPKATDSGKLVSHAGGSGDAKIGEVIFIDDGTSDGEAAQVRLYADRKRTS